MAGRSSSLPISNPFQQTVGVVYSTKVNEHRSWVGDHFECPERITRTWELITESGCDKKLKLLPIRPAHKNHVLLVHSEDHWDEIQNIQRKRFVSRTPYRPSKRHICLDMTRDDVEKSKEHYDGISLYVNPETTQAALLSCGGVIEACLAVARDMTNIKKAIAIVRPPGHHAEPSKAMGFCFFNNVAVACKAVQQETGIQRILILDWYISP